MIGTDALPVFFADAIGSVPLCFELLLVRKPFYEKKIQLSEVRETEFN